MSLSVSNKKNIENEEKIDQLFVGIKNHLDEAVNSISKSHTYFKVGIEDDFVNYLNQYVANPLTTVSLNFDGHINAISSLLEGFSQGFFNTQKENILKIFKSNPKGNFLHFYIILKEDTLKNRRPFFTFLNKYDKEIISKQFPIMFEFISPKKEDEVKKDKTIILTNGNPSKKGKV